LTISKKISVKANHGYNKPPSIRFDSLHQACQTQTTLRTAEVIKTADGAAKGLKKFLTGYIERTKIGGWKLTLKCYQITFLALKLGLLYKFKWKIWEIG